MNWTNPTTQRAAKQHRCTWCWQFIDAGDNYTRYRFFSYGDASTVKMHPECYGAMQDAAREEGGNIEWTPGQERPATPTAGREDSNSLESGGIRPTTTTKG